MDNTKEWYEKSYKAAGIKAQRQYPNEELLRFLGRNYFALPKEERIQIKLLEVGCGSCSNLWMVSREGFQAFGIDLSKESIELGKQMLKNWGVQATLNVGTMTKLPYESNFFDVIIDVFSSNCLNTNEFQNYIGEARRVLKSNGKIFIYTPSVNSEAFRKHAPATKIDEYTLNGIYRIDSPYYGNFYPFRFESVEHLGEVLAQNNFKVKYCELVTRTYNNLNENFQHLSLEAYKL